MSLDFKPPKFIIFFIVFPLIALFGCKKENPLVMKSAITGKLGQIDHHAPDQTDHLTPVQIDHPKSVQIDHLISV